MAKEWAGGLLVDPDFKKDELFLYKHSTLIANTLSKGYDIPVNSDSLIVSDFERCSNLDVLSSEKFNISIISDKEIKLNYIYSENNKKTAPFLTEKYVFFNSKFDNLSLILSTLYSDVKFIYSSNISFHRSCNSFINNFFTNKFNILNSQINVFCFEPLFKDLNMPDFFGLSWKLSIPENEFELSSFYKFIHEINMKEIVKEIGVKICVHDDIEELKNNLSIIEMNLI